MKTIVIIALLLLGASTSAEAKSLAGWQAQFKGLSSGTSRQVAEKEIAQIRGIKSTYELWAMDTSALVAYRLDSTTILLVTYKPGIPAAHVAAASRNGGHPPVDGILFSYQLLELR